MKKSTILVNRKSIMSNLIKYSVTVNNQQILFSSNYTQLNVNPKWNADDDE